MKFFKKLLKIIIGLLVLFLVGVWLFSKTYHPNYNDEIKIKNLSEEVSIYFDDIGVPHIYAKNQKDAYMALGYVHAQDRLWQMELIRRIASGRLSEIFGEKLLGTDLFFSGLGLVENANEVACWNNGKSNAMCMLRKSGVFLDQDLDLDQIYQVLLN